VAIAIRASGHTAKGYYSAQGANRPEISGVQLVYVLYAHTLGPAGWVLGPRFSEVDRRKLDHFFANGLRAYTKRSTALLTLHVVFASHSKERFVQS